MLVDFGKIIENVCYNILKNANGDVREEEIRIKVSIRGNTLDVAINDKTVFSANIELIVLDKVD